MNYATAYRICLRLAIANLVLLVSLVCYAVADYFTHHAWVGIPGIVAFWLVIRPLYFWLLDLPERYE